MKVRTHRFNGVKYRLDIDEPFVSLCETPHSKDLTPHIRIAEDPMTKEGLVCLIHECLHAESFAKGENVVDRCATEIGSLLWRLGYRRKKK